LIPLINQLEDLLFGNKHIPIRIRTIETEATSPGTAVIDFNIHMIRNTLVSSLPPASRAIGKKNIIGLFLGP
jgi:hypothetical protein